MISTIRNQFIKSLTLIAFGLNALTLLLGNLKYRFLMHDGAFMTFEALQGHYSNTDPGFNRQFHALLQAPALKLSQWISPGEHTHLFLRLLGLTYWIFPMASLWISFCLLKKYRRLHLFYFVLISFSLVSMGVLPNTGGLVADNLSTFWPCLILVFFAPRFELNNFFVSLGILFIWCFSHETSILMVGFLLVASFLRPLNLNKNRRLLGGFQVAASFVICRIAYTVLNPHAGVNQWFRNDLLKPWSSPRILPFILLLIFSVFVVSNLFRLKTSQRAFLWSSVCVTGYFLALISGAPGWQFFWGEVEARTSAVPLCLLIATLALGCEHFRERWKFHRWSQTKTAAWFLILALVSSAGIDFYSLRNWERTLGVGQSWKETSSSCLVMNADEFLRAVQGAATDLSTEPLVSILLQFTRVPSHILFVQHGDWAPIDYCLEILEGKLNVYGHDQKALPSVYFDFAPLLIKIRSESMDKKSDHIRQYYWSSFENG